MAEDPATSMGTSFTLVKRSPNGTAPLDKPQPIALPNPSTTSPLACSPFLCLCCLAQWGRARIDDEVAGWRAVSAVGAKLPYRLRILEASGPAAAAGLRESAASTCTSCCVVAGSAISSNPTSRLRCPEPSPFATPRRSASSSTLRRRPNPRASPGPRIRYRDRPRLPLA